MPIGKKYGSEIGAEELRIALAVN